MEWLLGISVVFNVVLALFAGVVMVYKIGADNEAFHAREEWRRWEERFYEAQGKLLRDHNLFVAPTMGEFGKMIITKHKDT